METTSLESHVAVFERERARLTQLAYRMLGSYSEAEDVVQEAYLRFQAEAENVLSPVPFLRKVVTRMAIDQLRSARVSRAQYVGPWLPEPILTAPAETDPEQSLSAAQSVSLAFLVVLERLSPIERAVLLLRQVFEWDYDDIAETVGKTPANCRQILHRALEQVNASAPPRPPEPEERAVVMEFVAALGSGSAERVLELLADDAVYTSDGGGKVSTAQKPIRGAERIARGVSKGLAKWGSDARSTFERINGGPGVVVWRGSELVAAFTFDVRHGRIHHIYGVQNPEKLSALKRMLAS